MRPTPTSMVKIHSSNCPNTYKTWPTWPTQWVAAGFNTSGGQWISSEFNFLRVECQVSHMEIRHTQPVEQRYQRGFQIGKGDQRSRSNGDLEISSQLPIVGFDRIWAPLVDVQTVKQPFLLSRWRVPPPLNPTDLNILGQLGYCCCKWYFISPLIYNLHPKA